MAIIPENQYTCYLLKDFIVVSYIHSSTLGVFSTIGVGVFQIDIKSLEATFWKFYLLENMVMVF